MAKDEWLRWCRECKGRGGKGRELKGGFFSRGVRLGWGFLGGILEDGLFDWVDMMLDGRDCVCV